MSIYTTGLIYLGPARVIKDLVRAAKKTVLEIGGKYKYTPTFTIRSYTIFRKAYRLSYQKGLEDYYDKTTLKQRSIDGISERDNITFRNQFTKLMMENEALKLTIRRNADNITNILYNGIEYLLKQTSSTPNTILIRAIDKYQKSAIDDIRKNLDWIYYLGHLQGRQSLRLSHPFPEKSYTA